MDHEQATTAQAAERYILDDLTPDERDAFEDHYFSCEECADAVRSCTLLAENTRAVAKEDRLRPSKAGQVVAIAPRPVRPAWREWFTAVAAVLLLGVVGFQTFVTIPRLERQASSPGPIEAVLLHPLSRGAAPVVHTHGNALAINLSIDPSNAPATYEVTVRKVAGSVVAQFHAPLSKDGTLQLGWPSSREAGEYEILVRDPSRNATQAFPLQIER
jgi:anti-sigma factor RsiW